MRTHPSLSIIITNYNYANYLTASVRSAIRQTRPALEVIVVDDGSSDGSLAILEDFGALIKVVSKPNGGQASAFNAGFEASRGDLVYFLDADDIARPELVETVTGLWHDSLAALCFGLELIDPGGRHIGIYDVLPHDLDNRPLFVNTGSFDFLPTSGNVFARRVLERLMPMEEERWRICADAVLLRAAAIEGRIMPVRRALAAYRVHTDNNYYVHGASELWRNRRGMRDLSDLAETFAQSPRFFGSTGETERDCQAIALMAEGVRSRAYRAANFDRHHQTGPALRRLGRRIAGTALPYRTRFGIPVALMIASLLAQRSATVRRWLAEPCLRPQAVISALWLFGYRSYDEFRNQATSSRWRVPQTIGRTYRFTETTECLPMLRDGWRMRSVPGAIPMTGTRARLSICFNPSYLAYVVKLSVLAHHLTHGVALKLLVRLHGEVLASIRISGDCTVDVPLPERTTALGGEVLLELEIQQQNDGVRGGWLRRLSAAMPTIAIESITVDRAETPPRTVYVEDGIARPFAEAVVDRGAAGFVLRASGSAELVGQRGRAALSLLTSQTPDIVTLHLPPEQPSGLMRISADGQDLYSGDWGVMDRLQVDLPRMAGAENRQILLTFAFKPADLLDTRRPVIAAMSFRRRRNEDHFGVRPSFAPGVPSANPGQLFSFDAGSPAGSALARGWSRDHDGVPVATEGSADLNLHLSPDGWPLAAILDVSPVLDPIEGLQHVVGVSHNGELLVQTLIEGGAEIEVPLSDLLKGKRGTVELSLHSFLVSAEDGVIRPGPLRLSNIHFSAPAYPRPAPEAIMPPALIRDEALWGGGLEGCLSALDRFLDDMPPTAFDGDPDGSGATGALLAFRTTAIRAISVLGDVGLRGIFASEDTLWQIARLQTSLDMVFVDADRGQGLDRWPSDPVAALRQALIALAIGQAWQNAAFADLAGLPAPLLWHVSATADFLVRSPSHICAPADRDAYSAFVGRLVLNADEQLARAAPGSALHQLARLIIRHFQPRHLLFSEGTAVSAVSTLGRAIERYLLQEGYPLAWIPPVWGQPQARLRVGVILRAWDYAPEARIVAGLLTATDPRLQTVRITLTTPDVTIGDGSFDESINLDGLDVGQSVEIIRAARLDVILLGSYFLGLDQLAAIYAHRLAPIQLAMAAISPTSTGLSVVDGMLTSEELDPVSASPGYCEEIIRLAGPVQRFGLAAPGKGTKARPKTVKSRVRSVHGLPPRGTVFVSGAMVQKIGSDLLDAFASILEQVDDAVLVLYPFAANWLTKYSPAAFRKIVAASLAARNLDPSRIRVLDPLSREAVTDLLASCDVYLDSFPYAGATTVVEALDQGCPIVALEGTTQRARQGAAWVRHAGLEEFVSSSVEGYVESAVRLGRSDELRSAAHVRIRAYLDGGPLHKGNAEFAAMFADGLLALAGKRGLTLAPPDAMA